MLGQGRLCLVTRRPSLGTSYELPEVLIQTRRLSAANPPKMVGGVLFILGVSVAPTSELTVNFGLTQHDKTPKNTFRISSIFQRIASEYAFQQTRQLERSWDPGVSLKEKVVDVISDAELIGKKRLFKLSTQTMRRLRFGSYKR